MINDYIKPIERCPLIGVKGISKFIYKMMLARNKITSRIYYK